MWAEGPGTLRMLIRINTNLPSATSHTKFNYRDIFLETILSSPAHTLFSTAYEKLSTAAVTVSTSIPVSSRTSRFRPCRMVASVSSTLLPGISKTLGKAVSWAARLRRSLVGVEVGWKIMRAEHFST